LATVAVYDYTAPSDATGMSDLFEQWKDQDVIEDGADLVSHSLDAANALLDDAGYEFNGDVRMAPDGTQLEFELIMPSGWSDWVQAGEIIAQNLQEIGVKVKSKGIEVTTWYDSTYTGDFQMSLGGTSVSAT